MRVQEHPYYGSFGYHVTNPFAPASRSGSPEELKALIDAAHGRGVRVLLDIVHSHICKNAQDGLAGFDFGQEEDSNYFKNGDAGYHSVRVPALMQLCTCLRGPSSHNPARRPCTTHALAIYSFFVGLQRHMRHHAFQLCWVCSSSHLCRARV